jgi:glycosyltransferase involved in cell wall biosynthesis
MPVESIRITIVPSLITEKRVPEMHTVSVVVPVYNVEDYINACIDSLLAQDYANTEIILVDDGSTDSSGKICDDYAQNNPSIIALHKSNGGPSSARNYGMDHATGDYALFVDSDDIIAPNTLSSCMEAVLQSGAELTASCSRMC